MILYVDIETIPTQKPHLMDAVREKVKHPASMKVAKTIEKWEAEQKEGVVQEAIDKTALNGGYGEIISIAYAFDDAEPTVIFREKGQGEKVVLNTFFMALRDIWQDISRIVGHNVLWDLKFIAQRAMILGVNPIIPIPWNAKAWDKMIFDTMQEWAGYGKYISLDELALVLGLAKKTMKGSDVYELYKEGRYKELKQYNANDVILARAAYKRMTFDDGKQF